MIVRGGKDREMGRVLAMLVDNKWSCSGMLEMFVGLVGSYGIVGRS